MPTSSLEQEIIEQIGRLDVERQRQVLKFIRGLTRPQGVSGRSLLAFAGRISPDDLRQMEEAIAECETIDPDEW